MNLTPHKARTAVTRVLAQVSQEHEAAYSVIAKAVHICIEGGMDRRKTAKFLDIQTRRINKSGHYVRTVRATRDLFRGAFNVADSSEEPSVRDIVEKAWQK